MISLKELGMSLSKREHNTTLQTGLIEGALFSASQIDPNQFFHGVGVDGVYLHFHKANQFLGMEALPTFICNDVIKQPDIETDIARYREHLAEIFA